MLLLGSKAGNEHPRQELGLRNQITKDPTLKVVPACKEKKPQKPTLGDFQEIGILDVHRPSLLKSPLLGGGTTRSKPLKTTKTL